MLPESSISAIMLVFNGKLGLVGDSVFQVCLSLYPVWVLICTIMKLYVTMISFQM